MLAKILVGNFNLRIEVLLLGHLLLEHKRSALSNYYRIQCVTLGVLEGSSCQPCIRAGRPFSAPLNLNVGRYGAETPQADGFRYLYKD